MRPRVRIVLTVAGIAASTWSPAAQQSTAQQSAAQQSAAPPSTAERGRGRGPLGGQQAGFVQNPGFDSEPPALPAGFRPGGVLIFSKTNGYRDEPAIQASNAALAAIATVRNWPAFVTENGAVMNADQLKMFKLVIWNNASGDVLNESQRAAFRNWLENGGAWLGTHGAGGDPVLSPGHTSLADWKWYVDAVVGAQFVVHSSIMPGDIHVEDPNSPIMKGLPRIWHRSEEWYSFAENPRKTPGVHILATVDEKSYTPGRATMGDDHPLIWWHCVGKGRAVYSALGHAAPFYSEPLMITLLDNAMGWLVAESGKACAAAPAIASPAFAKAPARLAVAKRRRPRAPERERVGVGPHER